MYFIFSRLTNKRVFVYELHVGHKGSWSIWCSNSMCACTRGMMSVLYSKYAFFRLHVFTFICIVVAFDVHSRGLHYWIIAWSQTRLVQPNINVHRSWLCLSVWRYYYVTWLLYHNDVINVLPWRCVQEFRAGCYNKYVTNKINNFKKVASGSGCKIV